MLRILLTGESFKVLHSGKLIEGKRSVFQVGPVQLAGMQRGNGYVALPPGVYMAEMDLYRSREDAPERQCLRFLERISGDEELTEKQRKTLSQHRFLVHAATKPWELEGCFSVGVLKDEAGVLSSGEAMRILMDGLGGFERGKKVRVKIEVKAKAAPAASGSKAGAPAR